MLKEKMTIIKEPVYIYGGFSGLELVAESVEEFKEKIISEEITFVKEMIGGSFEDDDFTQGVLEDIDNYLNEGCWKMDVSEDLILINPTIEVVQRANYGYGLDVDTHLDKVDLPSEEDRYCRLSTNLSLVFDYVEKIYVENTIRYREPLLKAGYLVELDLGNGGDSFVAEVEFDDHDLQSEPKMTLAKKLKVSKDWSAYKEFRDYHTTFQEFKDVDQTPVLMEEAYIKLQERIFG